MSKLKKAITYLSIGKLAVGVSAANAGGIGKVESSSPTLSIDEIGHPIQILTPPLENNEFYFGGKQENSAEGFLFADDITAAKNKGIQPRIDFIINGIKNNYGSANITFLSYSTKKGDPSQWSDINLPIQLDRETMTIIGAVETAGARTFGSFEPTALGTTSTNQGSSAIISLHLADINTLELEEDAIYFQAISVPLLEGNFIFDEAVVSELDTFLRSNDLSDDNRSGSKLNENGSKSANSNNGSNTDNGGK